MSNGKWSDLTPEQQSINKKDMGKFLDGLNKIANKAFERKSKLLTASNAGGIIAVIGYLQVSRELGGFIIITLGAFFIGLITNGCVMFMAEKRQAKRRDDFEASRDKLMADTLTFPEHQKELDDSYKLNLENMEDEDRLEDWSGYAFVFGVVIIIIGMLIKNAF